MISLWCSSCVRRQPVETTELGYICCVYCGKVIDQVKVIDHVTYSDDNEPSYVGNAGGQARGDAESESGKHHSANTMQKNTVKRIQSAPATRHAEMITKIALEKPMALG